MAIGSESTGQQLSVIMADSLKYRSFQILLVVLTACFLLQVFSPLRLNNDAIILLSIGESAAHGGGFSDGGLKAVFPPGYPALLAVLLRVGLAHPWVIVGLNMVFLSVGLVAVRSVLIREFFEDRALVLMICSFFLLSYVVIKHSTIPLTDVPFFCCSMTSIAVMSQARKADSGWRLAVLVGVAGLLVLAAMAVRTIGAALFPSLIFVIVGSPQFVAWLKRLSLHNKLMVAAGGAFVGGVAALMLAATPYWQFFIVAKKGMVSTLISQTLFYRLVELGELFINFPTWKLPAKPYAMVACMGLLLFLLLLLGLAQKRKEVGPCEVFLVSYMVVLLFWPYEDARYWLPIMPFVGGYAILAVKGLRLPKVVVTVYCVAYATLGFGAIAYNTRITFAGSNFPDRYGDGGLRSTYCAAFQSCRDGGDPNKVDAKVLRLLQEYK
jgi:hypothetical protein